MGQAIPAQHPAVVLRSHYRQLRALLAIAMIAVVGLTATVVILSVDEGDESASPAGAKSALTPQEKRWSAYDEAIRSLTPEQLAAAFGAGSVAPGTRYDGGPEEGTAALTRRAEPATFDPNSIKSPPGVRYDGGPEEGRGSGR